MYKFFYSLFLPLLILITFQVNGQVSINTDGSNPDPSAILDVKSTNKGILIPRVTQAEIKTIVSPANGLMVFNTDENKLYIYVASELKWKEVQLGNGEIACPASLSIGSGNACSNTIVNGDYKTNVPLTETENIIIDASVTTTGCWQIETDTINGFSFSGNGTVTTTGTVQLTLNGSGTPVNPETDTFTATVTIGGNSSCTFNVVVQCYKNCDDGNPCTIDSLDTNNCTCINTAKNCDDGNPCTDDSCDPSTGTCVHTQKNCDDSDPCTDDSCDPATGNCTHTAKNCDDGNPCTDDSCDPSTGTCVHTQKNCDDGNPCTDDSCDPSTGTCVHTQKNCDDGDLCTDDSCDPATGDCIHTPKDCDDNDPNTNDYCDPATGSCVHEQNGGKDSQPGQPVKTIKTKPLKK